MDTSIRDKVSAMHDAEMQHRSKAQDISENLRNTQHVVTSITNAVATILRYMERKDFAVDVKNFPTSISTPDSEKVVTELKRLHESLSKRDNSANDVTTHKLLENLLQAVQKLPTDIPEAPEALESITVKNMPTYDESFKELIEAVKAIEVSIEPPKVSVQAPDVTVNTDLTALESKLDLLLAAINAIELVVPENDDQVLSAVMDVTSAIKNLRFPVPNFTAAFKDEEGVTTPAVLDNGRIPVVEPKYATRIDNTSTTDTTYIGSALPGSSDNDPVWRIMRLDTSTGIIGLWADGDTTFDNVWDDRITLTYS